MGEAPLKTISGLKPGSHILKVVKPGYSEYLETVSIQPAKITTVAVDLVALFGVVTIEANIAGAVVAIDGKSVGPTPVAAKELIPGEHVIRVTSDGYRDFETTLRVAAGEDKVVKATLLVKSDDKQRLVAGNGSAGIGPDLSAKPSSGSAGAIRFTPPEETSISSSPPFYKRWWVWAIAGGVVAGAVTTGIAMKASGPGSPYMSKAQEDRACGSACAAVVKTP